MISKEEKIKAGVQWDAEGGHSWFGLEEVNSRLASGQRIARIEEGAILVSKLGEVDGHVQVYNSGCSISVVFEVGR